MQNFEKLRLPPIENETPEFTTIFLGWSLFLFLKKKERWKMFIIFWLDPYNDFLNARNENARVHSFRKNVWKLFQKKKLPVDWKNGYSP